MPDSLGCIGSEGEVGMVQLRDVSVCRRGLMEWWWGVRTQEPVLLGDGGRDALAACRVRWLGGGCSGPAGDGGDGERRRWSGGGAAVMGAGAMAAASGRGAARAWRLAAAVLRRRAAGDVAEADDLVMQQPGDGGDGERRWSGGD